MKSKSKSNIKPAATHPAAHTAAAGSSGGTRAPKRNRINRRQAPIAQLRAVMATLRSPTGCPWDREQTHRTLRFHAVEEVYELLDAIEAGDESEMIEELGDLLLQVVFHAQLASEREAFDFDAICRNIVEKLIRRHPHVFGDSDARTVDAVWAQWEQIKKAEKRGTRNHRPSALDGIPRHLPALLRAEKLAKKARKAGLMAEKDTGDRGRATRTNREAIGRALFDLASAAQRRGWSAEELLLAESRRREHAWRREEARGQRAEGRRQRAGGRGQGAGGRRQRAEGRGQRAEGRGQRAEGRGQKAEGRGQR